MAARRMTKPGKSKAKKPPTTVDGIKLKAVNAELVSGYYSTALLEHDKMKHPPIKLLARPPLDKKVGLLSAWYKQTVEAKKLCTCNTCGGWSSEDLDECPFCGEEGVTDPAQPIKPEPRPVVAAPVEVETHGEVQSSAVEVVETSAVDAGLTVEDLDKHVRQVLAAKVKAAKGVWELGIAVKAIFDSGVWMLRMSEAQKRMYTNFKQFCVSELGMSYKHAWELMTVAAAFTRPEMESIGVTKCRLMLQVPAEKRAQLLEAAKGGASRAQLSKEVERIQGKERPSVPKGSLTVAVAPGRVEIPLLARPKKQDVKLADVTKKARTLADDPWAVEMLSNNVKVFYGVTRNKDGTMVLIVDRRRARSDEAYGGVEDGD